MTGDIIYLQTHDGKLLFVPDDEVRFIVYGNFGAPPVDWITRRGYRQHGVTEIDFFLNTRSISVRLWHSPACSRQQYWDNRLALHEFLRHNRNGPLTFILREPGGKKRALIVRADPGLTFPMLDASTNDWAVDEVIDFVAFDPVWFDPTVKSQYVASVVDNNLIFPITFPIRFGSASVLSQVLIMYLGTWVSHPTITLRGPYTSATIANATRGVYIYLTTPIAAGEIRRIDLTPEAIKITDGLGANRFGELGLNSNLVDFGIFPDPEVPGGSQVIQGIFLGGLIGTTSFQVDYYERYFAL